MKKILKIIILLLIINCTNTYAYFKTNNNLINTLHTIKYNIKININDSTILNNLEIINNKIKLPELIKDGYIFDGYNEEKYNNLVDIKDINNKVLEPNFNKEIYKIKYNLDGGVIRDEVDCYTVEDEIIISHPKKENHTFIGWTTENNDVPKQSFIIEKGTTGDIELTANYIENKAKVNIIPVIDNIEYIDGLDDYTFSLYINDNLISNNLKTYNEEILIGSKIKVIANTLTGRTTSYNEEKEVTEGGIYFFPKWEINSYKANFYYNNKIYSTTTNKYKSKVKTPSLNASNLGLSTNFYYISSYTPTTSWYQEANDMKFNINVSEYYCDATFGTGTVSNTNSQLTRFRNYGYYFCTAINNNTMTYCRSNYSNVINLYNNSWNILPYSGSGYSRYKQIGCDSGWGTYSRR